MIGELEPSGGDGGASPPELTAGAAGPVADDATHRAAERAVEDDDAHRLDTDQAEALRQARLRRWQRIV